ncbi:MAG: chloride channel protein [Planctomycetota bacterium]
MSDQIKLTSKLRKGFSALGFEREWWLIAVGAAIGSVTALGAIGFAFLLHELEHWVAVFRERGEAIGGLWLLPLIPMAGALLSGLLVWRFASEAKGHGVPQVMKAIIQRDGEIPLRVGIVKIFASIFTVGSGGSAGTEGPIVQIGAVAGSFCGQRLNISREQLRTLVGCGAAAGIASIFNAPIAGVFFVLEILLRDFSVRTFSPIVVASVFSSALTHALTGENVAIFAAGESLAGYEFTFAELPSYVVLGVICGLVGVGFNALLHASEDFFAERIKLHAAIKPVFGALLLGLLGVAFLSIQRASGGPEGASPAFFGNGYETIRHLLDPTSYGAMTDANPGLDVVNAPISTELWLLTILVVAKALATCLTLGSGASGGVFAPSLFLGAVAGAALGEALSALGLIPANGSPAAYALVGMAAVVAGSTHAPLTAILILFELTQNVYVLLPIMLAAVVATIVSQLVERDSIYTYKLRREGVLVGAAKDLTLLRRLRVSDVEPTPIPDEAVYASDPLGKLIALHASHNVPDFVVVDDAGGYLGMVTGADMRAALIDREAVPLLLVAEVMRTDVPTLRSHDTLDRVMDRFSRYDVAGLCLVGDPTDAHPLGVPRAIVTRAKVMHRYQRALEFS